MSTYAFRLDSDCNPDAAAHGRLQLVLTNTGASPVSDFVLEVTSLFRIKPGSQIEGARLIEQLSNYHKLAPEEGFVLAPGASWTITATEISHTLRHYTYGPKSAVITLKDGTKIGPEITPMTLRGERGDPVMAAPARGQLPSGEAPISVIPCPEHVDVHGRRAVDRVLMLESATDEASAAFTAVSALAERLFPGEALFGSEGIAITCVADSAIREAGYLIAFQPDAVTLSAADMAGFRYGLISLAQMLRGARQHPEDFVFPARGTISDAPRFGWRGSHLDVARQVYMIAELKAFLDTMAWNKLNRFHIHLNDDEAWRLDIPAYPGLAEKAAWRGPGEILPPLLGTPFARHGIVYRAADISELVDHGLGLGIDIVPEIDIPGHCYCVLQALPQLRDPGENELYRSIQYFPNNALNPAVEETYVFLEAVIETLVRLFPSKWIHIGGDEVPEEAWTGSPRARAMEKVEGLQGSHQLQSYFLKRVQSLLARHGKIAGAWEEGALGGGIEADGAYLVAWKKSESGRQLAEWGYDVVLAPAEHTYFDMAQSADWWEPGASWAGVVTLEACYGFDPAGDWPEAARGRLWGVQSCLWSENLCDRKLFDHLVYPRLSAVAETAWSPPARKNYSRFMAIQTLMPRAGLG
ncbi:beta-N-acetylhexosaminidase [Pelagibacterium limicola]|uniref:beta-N-acetylhexosaminidase n=1 Tax=Pelagibacterium limicola TaxID=2791022 RepID=UPI0018AF62D0|nr:beta-N-acetylhexosaminidase [Pelagibacterium limicola]